PSRRGEEAYRFTVGGKEWSKRTLGIGKSAGNRLVEIAHPEGGVRSVVANERHPPARRRYRHPDVADRPDDGTVAQVERRANHLQGALATRGDATAQLHSD